MAENVRVVVRCRPINSKEIAMKCQNIIKIEDCTVTVQNPSDLAAPAKTFTYDNAYDTISPTEAIYNDICYSLVENVLEGYNGTIFAYGQTGCGKSHTMQKINNTSNFYYGNRLKNNCRLKYYNQLLETKANIKCFIIFCSKKYRFMCVL